MVHLAARVFNTPLLIHPGKGRAILWALRERLGVDIERDSGPEASDFYGSRRRDDGSWSFARAHNGVAIVAVHGTLVNRGAWLDSYSGETSYEGMSAQLREIEADAGIRSVILDIDSFGGEAAGVFTLTEQIRALRENKRVVAVVNDHALSGGYAIASAASEIVVSRTSSVGSIGVVWVHMDYSEHLEGEGIKPTLIHAGARKVDGNPYEPLTDEARERMQDSVDTLYAAFLAEVALGRGKRLSKEAARATEATDVTGEAAIKAGLADRVGTFADVLAELEMGPSARRKSTGALLMSTESGHEADEFEIEAAHEVGKGTGAAEERKRIAAILALPEAKGREGMAQTIATTTDLSPEAAAAILKSAPQAAQARTIPSLEERSEQSPLGNMSGGGSKGGAAAWADVHRKTAQRRYGNTKTARG